MKRTSELYKEAREEYCCGCKIKIYRLIASYLNKKVSTTDGKLGRGFNVHIHPDTTQEEHKPSEFNSVAWVPSLDHTCGENIL